MSSLLELGGPALFLGPGIRMGTSVVLELLEVGVDLQTTKSALLLCNHSLCSSLKTYQLLLAKDADGRGLGGLLGGTVGVDGDASAGGFGLFVLAVDTVLLGDGHLEM